MKYPLRGSWGTVGCFGYYWLHQILR